MHQILKHFFKDSPSRASAESTLALQAENQRLSLALEEALAKIGRLESELERQQRSASELQQASMEARLFSIFEDLAGPAAQLLLQLELAEAHDHALQAGDVLAVANALLRALRNQGLEILEPAGSIAAYDPACHIPLSTSNTLQPGQAVCVRLPGLAYRGQRLRKAGVVAAEG